MNIYPKKSYCNRIKSGKKQYLKIIHQHELIPWTYILWLTFPTPVNIDEFLKKLNRHNKGRFNIAWTLEQAKNSNHYHLSGVIRTQEPIEELRNLIELSLTDERIKKSNRKIITFDLRCEIFDDVQLIPGAIYQSKSTYKLLQKNVLQDKGKREFFITGKPWTKLTKELTKLTDEEKYIRAKTEMMNDPQFLYEYMIGNIKDSHLNDGRFIYRWQNYYKHSHPPCQRKS
jgi:hypothetical protein